MSDKNNITGEAKELLLAKLLEDSKKHRIKSIAERYNIKLSEKNTKQQMIDAALPAIEMQFGVKLKHYSNDELQLAMNCFTESEISEQLAEEVMNSAPFADGAIFITSKKDKFYAAVPHELAGKLMMRCVKQCKQCKQCTQCTPSTTGEIDRCALACAAIYGSFTPGMLANAANTAYSIDLTDQQAEQYLTTADTDAFAYADGMAVSSSAGSLEVQQEAAAIDFYIPSRGEIEAYAAYGADSSDYYYRQIVNFVYNNTDITYDKAAVLMREIADWCRKNEGFAPIFETLKQSGLRLSPDQYNYLLGMIGELSNRTRKPSLKGHKPEEIEGLKSVIIPSVQISAAKREPVRVEHKIGRNDLCPCGSGKKYKKCCGKNK